MPSRIIISLLTALLFCTTAAAETTYQPFVLASISEQSLSAQTEAATAALEAAGFTVSGHYKPLPNAAVIVVTSPELKSIAAQTERGGFGAAQRIGIAERDGKTEVSFVNPLYIQHAYRLQADMQPVYDRLSATLGNVTSFGTEKGLSAKKLAKYNYKVAMEQFDDLSELGSFPSYEAALQAVEQGLAREGDALTQIYRIDIPGKQQSVFGVGMKASGRSEEQRDIDEAFQLSVVDFEGHSKAAYFPYEILVNGNEVEALHMRFRMAVHFPDLSMFGEHGFMQLRRSPGATEDAFEAMLGSN